MINLQPTVIGHRGACGYAPENTLLSFIKACDLGITWVEFDVRLAACGKPVVFHDSSLERTTTGHGNVESYSYAELVKLDAGKWFNQSFSGLAIPTLKETLELLKNRNCSAIVEIKPCTGSEVILVSKIIELIRGWGTANRRVILSSFSSAVLRAAKQIDSTQPLALALGKFDKQALEIALQLGCESIHLNQKTISKQQVDSIKNSGLLVYAYTVNDPLRAKELFDLGVQAVFSDFPDKILHEIT